MFSGVKAADVVYESVTNLYLTILVIRRAARLFHPAATIRSKKRRLEVQHNNTVDDPPLMDGLT